MEMFPKQTLYKGSRLKFVMLVGHEFYYWSNFHFYFIQFIEGLSPNAQLLIRLATAATRYNPVVRLLVGSGERSQ